MTAKTLLETFNTILVGVHKKYEDLFWTSYMGDHSVDDAKDKAQSRRDAFYADPKHLENIATVYASASAEQKKRLAGWKKFFELHQTPPDALHIKKNIDALETKIKQKIAKRREGYIDPYTKKFVKASILKMGTMISTHTDEKVRHACYQAKENLSQECLSEYIALVGLRNSFARALGFKDFYDYKVRREDGMTKDELFGLFDDIYKKTRYAFKDIRTLEKKMPGLRKPWNFSYMMTGNFTTEEDPFFQFKDALGRWGRSFTALGIDFSGGKLYLDLLDREGKYNNGFCHWPDIVHYSGARRVSGRANFTCNVVPGQVGSGIRGYETLFHEGGHAAHFLSVTNRDACFNTEYAPMSASWAETQSMFIDTLMSSIEWKMRYAKDSEGRDYPFELYTRMVEKLAPIRPMSLNGIMFVSEFEKQVYEAHKLSQDAVRDIARRIYRKYYDRTEDSLLALSVPHIYSSESSASYHGYGLATLALSQWREYFYKKYGYIVDNKQIGKEMKKVWCLGSQLTFAEYVKIATGKKLSSSAYLREATMSSKQRIARAKKRVQELSSKKGGANTVNLKAEIYMVHGKKVIATSKNGFTHMEKVYGAWLTEEAKR
jgi:Zn-dependent oligopeptidase